MIDYGIIMTLVNALMVLVLLFIGVIDIRSKTISQKLLLILLLGSTAAIYFDSELSIINAIAAAMLMFSTLSIIYYTSRKSIGWGDVKLCSCIALYIGVEGAFSMLFISMLLCGLYALVLLIGNKSNRNIEIPFAPFVAIGTISTLVIR